MGRIVSVGLRKTGAAGGSRSRSVTARSEVARLLAAPRLFPLAFAVPRNLRRPLRRSVHGQVGRVRTIRHAGLARRGRGRVPRRSAGFAFRGGKRVPDCLGRQELGTRPGRSTARAAAARVVAPAQRRADALVLGLLAIRWMDDSFPAMGAAAFHRHLCRSSRWRRRVEREVLPWTLQGVELGDDALEVGAGLFGALFRAMTVAREKSRGAEHARQALDQRCRRAGWRWTKCAISSPRVSTEKCR